MRLGALKDAEEEVAHAPGRWALLRRPKRRWRMRLGALKEAEEEVAHAPGRS